MAGNGKRGAGDRILESRHLVGLFLGVVLLCAVFFTLGYVMGRNQYGGSVHAQENPFDSRTLVHPSVKPKSADAMQAGANSANNENNSEWDFYSKKGDSSGADAKLSIPAPTSNSASTAGSTSAGSKEASSKSAIAKPAQPSGAYPQPHLVRGSIVLQVAAVTRQGDALAMADVLQQKRFPSFVVAPTTDSFYRVQVGPYRDEKSADAARTELDHDGFMAIIKR
jgi:DedD protein